MNQPTPAIVTQLAARRLPRLVLLLLTVAYVLPGLLGRQPWHGPELASFGVMLDMVRGSGDWLHPQILGQAADTKAWLPYWLGAAAIKLLPFLSADLAVRVPYGVLLALTLTSTWYAMFHLARLPGAQPVSFAFGGEARPTDYARAIADAALLALVASLGLATLSHESTPDAAQLAFSTLLLYACARLASPFAERRWLSIAVWWLGTVGLALSGAPWLGLVLGAGWLMWGALTGQVAQNQDQHRWLVWVAGATGTLLAALLAWKLELPRRMEVWTTLDAWLQWSSWQDFGRLMMWFTWPAGLLALWTVWRWRKRLTSPHVLLPLWFAAGGLMSSWLLHASDRAMLLALPGLACLAAFALPTLTRSITALIDWFALLFFTGCAAIVWFYWSVMLTGFPSKPAVNVARLIPGFEATFSPLLFAVALVASLLWAGLVAWRVGRHRPALWKSLVLSATGSTFCWLLLMTLWLPALNHGLGQEPISRRIAAITPPESCVLVHGMGSSQIAALQYHGSLKVERLKLGRKSDCQRLVVAPSAIAALQEANALEGWALITSMPRLRENREYLMVFERRR